MSADFWEPSEDEIASATGLRWELIGPDPIPYAEHLRQSLARFHDRQADA